MSDKPIKIILVNYNPRGEKRTKIKFGTCSVQEKQDFIAKLPEYANDFADELCSLNIHHDKLLTHIPARGMVRQFVPRHSQNTKNELIIETIPNMEYNECWANAPIACPKCINEHGCTSHLIKDLVYTNFGKEKQ